MCSCRYQQQVYPPQPPPAPVTLSAPPGVPRPPASHAPVAFTAVAAKAPPSAPKSAEKPGASQWPSSLKAFVERAFAAAKGPEGKAELQGRLKELIGGAQRRGELWSIDWENQPLPTLGQQEPTLSPEQRGPREHFSIKRNTFSPAIKKAQRWVFVASSLVSTGAQSRVANIYCLLTILSSAVDEIEVME